MGILDSILGSVLGSGSGSSPLGSILSSILGGSGSGGSAGGLGGLLQQLNQAGHGDKANSWVGNGPNQPIDPGHLRDVFGQDRVSQWSKQTGMGESDILSQLSNLIPKAVDQMTPGGQVQHDQAPNPFGQSASGGGASSGNPFDDAGTELAPR